MFKDIKFKKNLYDNEIVKEFFYLKNFYYTDYSNMKLNNNNLFFKDKVIKNKKDGGIFTIKKELKKEYDNYKNNIFVRTKELTRIRKEKNLTPIFLTITLPSEFHPFRRLKNDVYELNENFNFDTIQERNDEGNKLLNSIFRDFYKMIKKDKNKEMKYIKVNENHKSLIIHTHRILFINKLEYRKITKKFRFIKKKYNLQQTKMKHLKTRSRSSYVLKYVLKNFKSEELKQIDGWKKLHKIRIITMSNLELSNNDFKKLYYNNKNNDEIVKEIKENKYHNIYEYFTKNTKVKKIFVDRLTLNIKKIKENTKEEKTFSIKKVVFLEERIREQKETRLYKSFEIYEDLYKKTKQKYVDYGFIVKKEKEKSIDLRTMTKIITFHLFYDFKNKVKQTYYKIQEFNILKNNEEIYNIKDYELLYV